MKPMPNDDKQVARRGRRTFLAGLLTGAGAFAALGGQKPGTAAAKPAAPPEQAPDTAAPILYRRTAEVERYYRTLYY
jgi:hypothetical protein